MNLDIKNLTKIYNFNRNVYRKIKDLDHN